MDNPRKVAVSVLLKIEKDSAYSNLTLGNYLRETELTNEGKAFVSALVYGVLDRRFTLDYILQGFMKTPFKKTAPYTKQVLRTALYQILFMEKIPDSAAVNEAVKLIKKSKENRNSGFVNAVLRSALRSDNILPEGNSPKELSIKYSCPEWIVESFIKDYGIECTKGVLEESLKSAPLTIRVNTVKTTTDYLKNEFLKVGIQCNETDIKDSFILNKGFDIASNEHYKNGYFYVQDIASQIAISVLAPKAGERVLDVCSAPGGKAFTMAQYMENKGEIVACDLYEQRVGLISDSAKRLGLDIIETAVADASVYNSELGKFDCILCDVPCSGLGVLRRKPDIKYKPQTDFGELEEIQLSILKNAVKYLKKGGRILYSTCTLRKAENEKLVNRFQMEYNNLHKVLDRTLFPHIDGADGFYFALLEDRGE